MIYILITINFTIMFLIVMEINKKLGNIKKLYKELLQEKYELEQKIIEQYQKNDILKYENRNLKETLESTEILHQTEIKDLLNEHVEIQKKLIHKLNEGNEIKKKELYIKDRLYTSSQKRGMLHKISIDTGVSYSCIHRHSRDLELNMNEKIRETLYNYLITGIN